MIEKAAKTPRKSNMYFTKMHQDAIVEYVKCSDNKKKNEIYKHIIEPVFRELISKIVYTFKFTSLPNIDDLKNDCAVHLVTVLANFDESLGNKAFSYFSIVTKNWFIGENKKNLVRLQKEVSYDTHIPVNDSDVGMVQHGISRTFDEELVTSNGYFEKKEISEFWGNLREEMDYWLSCKETNEQEAKTIKAIFVVLDNLSELEVCTKKMFYHNIRELTGMNSKQVVSNLNKIRKKYKVWKKEFDENEKELE